jgi:hypothetical protein
MRTYRAPAGAPRLVSAPGRTRTPISRHTNIAIKPTTPLLATATKLVTRRGVRGGCSGGHVHHLYPVAFSSLIDLLSLLLRVRFAAR